MTSIHLAMNMKNINAIVCLAGSGGTFFTDVHNLVKYSNNGTVVSSKNVKSCCFVALLRGVNLFYCKLADNDAVEIVDDALVQLAQAGIVEKNDKVIATTDQKTGTCGYTDTMTIRVIIT